MVLSVTFSTPDYCALFFRNSAFIPCFRFKFCCDILIYTFVTVFDAPYELLDVALAHLLNKYGAVLNIPRSNLQGYDGIQNEPDGIHPFF